MIKSFADEGTREFWEKGKSGSVPPNIRRVAQRKLDIIHAAHRLDDIKIPPGNKLHQLNKSRAGQHAIWVNDKYRVCFTWIDGHAHDVEITDYHDE